MYTYNLNTYRNIHVSHLSSACIVSSFSASLGNTIFFFFFCLLHCGVSTVVSLSFFFSVTFSTTDEQWDTIGWWWWWCFYCEMGKDIHKPSIFSFSTPIKVDIYLTALFLFHSPSSPLHSLTDWDTHTRRAFKEKKKKKILGMRLTPAVIQTKADIVRAFFRHYMNAEM